MGVAPGGGGGPLGPIGIRILFVPPMGIDILGPLVIAEEVVMVLLPVQLGGVAVEFKESGGVFRAPVCGGVAEEEGVELPELLLLDVAILLCRGLLEPLPTIEPPLLLGNGVVGNDTLL